MEQERVKYMHLRFRDDTFDISPYGGVTVAFTEHTDTVGFHYHYNMSFCNYKDHYCKKLGRMISSGRLSKDNKMFRPSLVDDDPNPDNGYYGQFIEHIYNELSKRH